MRNLMITMFLFVFIVGCSSTIKNGIDDEISVEEQMIESLIKKMTLEEKIGQMQIIDGRRDINDNIKSQIRNGQLGAFLNGGSVVRKNEMQRIAVEESRLRIPLLFGRDVIHGHRTIFPIPLGQAASWNPELVKKAARVAAREAASNGIHWTFAPMLDITRDPRWGRVAETLGEDPYLASQLGAAMVKGFQGDSLNNPDTIAACAKHYIGYGAAEGGRDYNTTWIPEIQLREVYLPPFQAAINAGAPTIMSAFNDINGIPTSGNQFTLKQILRNELGFRGFVVSDWESVSQMVTHGYCKNEKEAALKAFKAGVDMEMVSQTYSQYLRELLKEGKISEIEINTAVRNILLIKHRLGLFENPYTVETEHDQINQNHLQVAKELATQSIVLLQNNNNVLPLSKNAKVAIIGPLANSPIDQMGCWTFDGRKEDVITPLEAITSLLGKDRIEFSQGLKNSRDENQASFESAFQAAQKSDVVLLFMGEEQILTGEAASRASLELPGAQEELIESITKLRKPTTLVVLAGRPLILGNVSQKVDAIIYAWHPGTMGGPALADIIFGRTSPSGKLPITFPRDEGQIPIYYSHKNTGRPQSNSMISLSDLSEKNKHWTSKYIDIGHNPEYPFGFGLSYTQFEYTDLRISSSDINIGETVTLSVTIQNIGNVEADEIVQLYIRDLVGSVTRPIKELKNFKRVSLEPDEKQTVNFVIHTNDLRFWNINMDFAVEPGMFHVWVGNNFKEFTVTK